MESLRLCADYRHLDATTECNSLSRQRIGETIVAAVIANHFHTFDVASCYCQMNVYPKDRAKTAFMVPFGLCKLKAVTLALVNASATFQRMIQQVLCSLISIDYMI